MNPMIAKEKAMSSVGRSMANELEELNWELQMAEFNIRKLSAKYTVKKFAYQKFLGKELSKDEKDELKNAEEMLKDGCTL